MRKNLLKKFVVFEIIMLIVGTSVVSAFSGKPANNRILDPFNERGIADVDFERKISFYMKLGHMPSLSACIIKNNSVQWSQAFGECNRETPKDATLETIYMIASISKSICAVAIMQLLEEKLIESLDDDVNKYLDFELRNPNFPDVNISFRMLLAHQSSLASGDIMLFTSFSLLGYPRAWLNEFLIPDGRFYYPNIWLPYAPGQRDNYSSMNFEILAYLVERISQEPYENYVKEHIFQPLNMSSTSYSLSELNSSNLAVPYIWMAGRYIRLPFYENHNAGAGGAKSTVLDLAHYFIMHMNEGVYNGTRILNSTSIREIHRGQYPLVYENNLSYGLGWYSSMSSDGNMYGGHDGTIAGGRSVMRMRYQDNVGVIFCYNRFQLVLNREHSRPIRIVAHTIGQLEKFARQQIEHMLFEKAGIL
jgi:CubicO group peptidase (beta-lactamase class C family)